MMTIKVNSNKVILALLSAVALGGLSSSPNAQEGPIGTYRDSCFSAPVAGDKLTVWCKNGAGNLQVSTLDLKSCRWGSDIRNNNGRLRCDAGSSVPLGSYRQSCENRSITGNTLKARCKDEGGAYQQASLDLSSCVPGSDIANNNGQLQCYTGSSVPIGTYTQSCENAFIAGNMLKARCKDEGGGYQQSSLDLTTCIPSGNIGNDHGQLQCYTARN